MYRGLSNQILAQSINLGNYKLVNMYIFCTKRGKKKQLSDPICSTTVIIIITIICV